MDKAIPETSPPSTARTTWIGIWKKYKICICLLGLVLLAGIITLIWYYTLWRTFPNVDYMFLGYNMYKGFPLSDGRDPGFTYPIFTADYSEAKSSGDLSLYDSPRGFNIISDEDCKMNLTSKIVETSMRFSEYSSTSFGFIFFSYSKVSYERRNEFKKNVFIFTSATCRQYKGTVDRQRPPPFSESFMTWVRRLENADDSDEQLYTEFFDYFGTHFINRMVLGSKYILQFKMESSKLEKYRSESKSFSVNLGFVVQAFSFGFGYSEGTDSSRRGVRIEQNSQKTTITKGSQPPSNGNAETWASTVKSNPAPIKYHLTEIQDLFTKTFNGDLNVNYKKIYRALSGQKYKYCKYLRSNGDVYRCT